MNTSYLKKTLFCVFIFLGASSAHATLESKLLPSDGSANDWFGYSVSISGETAVVGAYGDDDFGDWSGSAYVFIRNGETWTFQAKLTADDAAEYDYFGQSVAISDNTAVVGAYGDDDFGSKSGSAYVFYRTGTTWTQQAKLTADDAATIDRFGWSVSINADTVVVGAHQDSDNGFHSGSAYVFYRTGTTWTQQAKLTADDADEYCNFGISVSISDDTAVAGAYGDGDLGDWSGSAYVFYRSGNNWEQQAKLTAADGAADDQFGYSVSISRDTAVIGAVYDDDFSTDSGSAYVFYRFGTIWEEQAKLTAENGAEKDEFGSSVTIDGDTVAVGSYSDAAYVFYRFGTLWPLQETLTAVDAAGDLFGLSVAISGDAVVVGGPYADGDLDTHSGAAYVYDLVDAGDVDGGGIVDLKDAIIALKISCGISTVGQNISQGSDCNQDGVIGIVEAVYILESISGVRE